VYFEGQGVKEVGVMIEVELSLHLIVTYSVTDASFTLQETISIDSERSNISGIGLLPGYGVLPG
jgi:hypothetical protein